MGRSPCPPGLIPNASEHVGDSVILGVSSEVQVAPPSDERNTPLGSASLPPFSIATYTMLLLPPTEILRLLVFPPIRPFMVASLTRIQVAPLSVDLKIPELLVVPQEPGTTIPV